VKTERVFITGCGGMLGNAIYPFFKTWYDDVLATDKDVSEDWLTKLDVRDTKALQKVFAEYKPDIVLHLAAETDLEYCEKHPQITQDTNSTATKTISQMAEKHGAALVYISTAGVFDGKKSEDYTEYDTPNPIMVYGQTKYEGELHTLKYCRKSYVIRAGWMMGGGKRKEKKFIYKILQQIGEGKKEIFAVDDKWGAPTYTYDFAMNLFLLIESKKYGLYHMVCEGKGNRYDVAKELLRICNRQDITLTKVKSDFFAEEYFAPRPPSEIMINTKLDELGINHMRSWQNALQDYISNYFTNYIGTTKETPDKTTPQYDPNKQRNTFCENFLSNAEYITNDGANKQPNNSPKRALRINTSEDECCLYVFDHLSEGEQLTLLLKTNGLTDEIATVRWVRQEKSGVFKVGLLFNSGN